MGEGSAVQGEDLDRAVELLARFVAGDSTAGMRELLIEARAFVADHPVRFREGDRVQATGLPSREFALVLHEWAERWPLGRVVRVLPERGGPAVDVPAALLTLVRREGDRS